EGGINGLMFFNDSSNKSRCCFLISKVYPMAFILVAAGTGIIVAAITRGGNHAVAVSQQACNYCPAEIASRAGNDDVLFGDCAHDSWLSVQIIHFHTTVQKVYTCFFEVIGIT